MKYVKKRWNKILSLILSLSVVLTLLPVQPLFAAEEITFDKQMVEMIMTGTESTKENISIIDWPVPEDATKEQVKIEWQSDVPEVATVAVSESDSLGKSVEVTAIKAGKANISCTVTYNDGQEGSEDTVYVETAEVVVKQKTVLKVKAEPENSTTYPNKVIFTVEAVPNTSVTGQTVVLSVLDKNDAPVNGVTPGVAQMLAVGEYKVKASVEAVTGEGGEQYLEAQSAELVYTVGKGNTQGNITDNIQEVYKGYEFTVNLPTPKVTLADGTQQEVEGNYSLSLSNLTKVVAEGEEAPENYAPGSTVTLKANAVGNASVVANFTPVENENFNGFDSTYNITVKKIPVSVVWSAGGTYEKVYDGTTSYIVTEEPTVIWEADEFPGREDLSLPTVSVENDVYDFVLEDKNSGLKTGRLSKEKLTLSNTEDFEIISDLNVTVNVKPIELDIENIETTGIVANGKGYDGRSDVKMESSTPSLKNKGNILESDFEKLSLGYEAHYCDNDGNKVTGNPNENTTATKVKFFNLHINEDGEVAANYKFADGVVIPELSGQFVIEANEEIGSFTGIQLDASVNEIYDEKVIPVHWISAEGISTLQKEGFEFSENYGSDAEPQWQWSTNYSLTEGGVPKKIYAKATTGDDKGLISKGAYIALDSVKPDGQIFAQIGTETAVSISELSQEFKTIAKGEGAEITFVGSDASSKIAKIECIGTDVAWTKNDADAWDGKTPTYTFEVNSEAAKETEITQSLQSVEKETELKRFYYARVTDHAGNVGYVSSSGVLLDVTVPEATVELSAASHTFENKNVYSEDVSYTVALKDNNISSGIVEVTAVLKKNGAVVKEYNTKTEAGWIASEALTAINTLDTTVNPTEEQINASRNITISGVLTELEEANSYTLEIVARDKVGHLSSVSEVSFIVDKEAPIVTIEDSRTYEGEKREYFTGGSIKVKVQDITLTTQVADLLTGIEDLEEAWVKNIDSATGLITQEIILEFGVGSSVYGKEGTYSFEVVAEDVLGRTGTDSCEEFTIDYTAPTYTVVYTAVDENAYTGEQNIYYHNQDIRATFMIQEDTTYDESKIIIKVKNKAGEEVIKWDNGTAFVKNANYVITHTEGTKLFVFDIKAVAETEDEGYTFEIEGQDEAGNLLIAENEDEAKEVAVVRALDVTAPKLTNIAYTTENGEDAKLLFNSIASEGEEGEEIVKDYINVKPIMTFTIAEKNPADSTYFLSSNKKDKVNSWQLGEGENEYTSSITVPMNGEKGDEQCVQYIIIDKAGNKVVAEETIFRNQNVTLEDGVFTDKFTVDTVKPKVKFEYEKFNPDRTVGDVDYFKQDMKVKVIVEEHNFNEVETEVALYSKSEKNKWEATEWKKEGADKYVKTFTFPGNEQYDMSIYGTDCANNDLVLQPVEKISAIQDKETKEVSLSVAIDKKLPVICDSAKPAVSISGSSSTTVGDNAGQPLYGGDVSFKVTVYDPVSPKFSSGMESVTINVTADNGEKAEATVSREGIINNGNGVTVTKTKGDFKKLGRGKENTIEYSVSISSKVFNSNNIILSVLAEDIATNKKEVEAEPISIDTTPPEAIISYDNNEVSNVKYFKDIRTANIQVTERNFSDECMTFNVNGSSVALNFSQVSSGSGNGDDAVWQATHVFEQDEEYIITAECADLIENQGTVQFEGEAAEEFIVDKTLPIIELEFDNNSALNENYYDTARTATIIITEHNFNADEVEIIGEGTNAGAGIAYPGLSDWSSSGDEHRATIYYSEDGLYTLDVNYSDLATNEAEDIEEEEFTVDTTDPEVMITGVEEQMPYSGEVRPEISFSDNNYDTHTITMTRTERENIGVDVTDLVIGAVGVSIDGSGKGSGSRILEDVEHLEENDGIYTLTVNVTDKAGRSTEETVTYSINRFGSVYVYSKDLADMIHGYYQRVEGDLYITAYNANQLVEDSTKLEITCDGSVIEKQHSEADLSNEMRVSEGGWYEYRFELEHDDFEKDGCYEISLSDKDIAGNTRTNSDTPVSFYIDATAPVIDSIIGMEEDIVNANEHQIQYAVSDAIALEQIAIYVNDEQVDKITEFESGSSYENSFTLGTGMRQSVRIVAKDKAGNVVDTATETFAPAYAFRPEITVSTSLLVRWYADTTLFWGTIVGAAVLVAGVLAIGVLKFRKKQGTVEEE